jgi:hypothetical protein
MPSGGRLEDTTVHGIDPATYEPATTESSANTPTKRDFNGMLGILAGVYRYPA